MSKVHSVASKGFNLQTAHYANARPSYPIKLIQAITSILPPKAHVVDLAAGTGLMTKLLVEANLEVTAVEPAENMRTKLTEILPKVTCLNGDSWNIPLKDSSQDAIVVAQAFHWFDDAKTLMEMHRVLKPKGYGILAWNLESSERADWVGPLRSLYETYDEGVPQYRKNNWRNVFETDEAKELFKLPFEERVFENDFLVPKENIWPRILSKSYISCLEKEEQDELEKKVNGMLKDIPVDENGLVLYPHDSRVVYFQRK
ncbi:S-adenosyl-L-methionine-dependent methyltransferase [Backusella circina FSU 941]|nr:S-adenosyl-L-methionine-dependent methyltransferase [Backusella circina FSU 941]